MTLTMTLKAAEEIGVSPRSAVMARLRFLMGRIKELERGIFGCEKRAASVPTKKGRTGYEALMLLDRKELEPLQMEAKILNDFINGKVNLKAALAEEITMPMKMNALSYPLEKLLEQEPKGTGRVVCCPFHKDSNPSASVKNNRLRCFAGCKPKKGSREYWDPIAFLMERDGLSYPAAVRALQ